MEHLTTTEPPATEPASFFPGAVTTETGLLVKRAQTGDPHAFDLLVSKFQDMAVGYGVALMGDFHLAEDAAQEAFLEAYRILPTLRVPDAFPAYLRLTLRKQCDRITRRKRITTVPLDGASNRAAFSARSVSEIAEQGEMEAVVRDAVRALPEPERVAVVLFYIGQRSLNEVAAFLDVPLSTVKNRLHAARRKLRERITNNMNDRMKNNTEQTLMEETLEHQRPSKNNRFRGQVISRLYAEYRRQFRDNKLTADRTLLQKANEELRAALAFGSPDTETAHAGVHLLIGTNDFAGLPPLMNRYQEQPLSPAEAFWAKWTCIRGLAATQQADAVVNQQRELMEWVRLHGSGDPPLRLSARDPFAPVEDVNADVLSPDTLSLFALGITEVGMCYHQAGVFDEWLAMVTQTLANAPKTEANRLWRFYVLRHAVHLLALYERSNEAAAFLEQIHALSNEENDWQAPRWPIEALILKLRMHGDDKNKTTLRTIASEAAARLNAYRTRPDLSADDRAGVLWTLTNNLAAQITGSKLYDVALPLWEQIAAKGLPNEWSYLWYAECVWAATKNREQTLLLLHEAAACRFDNELRDWFLNRAAGFADVRDDAEFLAALAPA